MKRALAVALLSIPLLGAGRSGSVTVMLINGGLSPAKNFHSHLLHLEGMNEALQARGIDGSQVSVFCADGDDPSPDMATRQSTNQPYTWLVAGTEASRLLPRIERVDTPWDGPRSPATPAAIEAWLATAPVQSGDTLLLYTTDHGWRDGEAAGLSLWQDAEAEPADLSRWLEPLPDGVRTVMVMSHCFSGAFADVVLADGLPDGSHCGFFSAPRTRPAYGCYPEGQSRRIGHGFRFIDALATAETLTEAHRQVLLTDRTPDVPLTTSDLFLQQVLAEEAAATGVPLAELADGLLTRRRPRQRRDDDLIDALATSMGLPRPAGVGELAALEAQALDTAQTLEDAAEVWEDRLEREAQSNLEALVAEQPHQQELVDKRDTAALAEVIDALQAQARSRGAWERMQDLASRQSRADAARWQAEVRAAGVLRIEALMLRQAGEALLWEQRRSRGPQREALQALRDCEAEPVGTPPSQDTVSLPPPWESLSEAELEAASLQPSLLGVRLEAVPEEERAALGLGEQGVRVISVREGTAAARAGLLDGDILIGPPGEHLPGLDAVRSWAALAPRDGVVVIELIRQGARVAVPIEFGVFTR